jgi:GMP synthase (glutamine-hydrolysing)
VTRRIMVVQSRPEDEVADAELEAMVRFGALDESRILRVRLDREIPHLELGDVDAVLVGGGPANFSDEHRRPPGHAETIAWLTHLGERVVRDDIPYLGACLGLGAIVHALGGRMVRGIAESVAPVELSLVGDHWLTAGLPRAFTAFGGHKEGIAEAPEGATTLAVSAACVHMIRVGQHVVGTQFHPELDADGLEQRIRVYRDHGYFSPDEVEDLVAAGRDASVSHPQTILARFAERYGLTR